VRQWFVDIGAKVEAGQLLAEIETPEIDQELNQAARGRAAGRGESRAGASHVETLGLLAAEESRLRAGVR
jgi:multidrug efflux pump subunit AcrA (membrane-fusion protein)